jgi:hypothetical protein
MEVSGQFYTPAAFRLCHIPPPTAAAHGIEDCVGQKLVCGPAEVRTQIPLFHRIRVILLTTITCFLIFNDMLYN